MEKIQGINGGRIAWCCAATGIAPGELAAALNVSPATVEKALAGERGLTFSQLAKIAEYFGRGVLFFLEPGPVVEEQIHTPAFRSLANQKPELTPRLKSLIERVEKQRNAYISLKEDLVHADFPAFSPPDLQGLTTERAAMLTRKWLGLGDKNNFNSYRTAVESRGLLVFQSNGYQGKWQIAKESPILGFSLYDAHCPVIVVKKRPWDSQQTFTLMHELGHILLHKESSIDDESDMLSHKGRESEANAFAGQLLIPNSSLNQIDLTNTPRDVSVLDDWLQTHRKDWGISTEVILRRLTDAGKLQKQTYAAYRDWQGRRNEPDKHGGSRAYRSREPMHMFGDTFVRTVLDSLSGRHITLAAASGFLDGLQISDLHKLEQHYAGV